MRATIGPAPEALKAAAIAQGAREFRYGNRHLAPHDSPVTYPLEPRKVARAPIPHHEGARRYYAEHGLLE